MSAKVHAEREVETFHFEPGNGILNSRLPLLLIRGAVEATGEEATALLERNGWTDTWIYTVYSFWHFHTEGHEALIGVSGKALIGFGGVAGV